MLPPTYRFDRFELDLARHELRADGAVRQVEPQVFDLLAHLAARAGELVTRDELVAAVWSGRIVSESAIDARISAARAAIDDDGRRQAMIRTVPRRGFRLVVQVERATVEAALRAPAAVAPVRFAKSTDGTRIAFATGGSGPPLVRAGTWLTHLDHDRTSPIWRPFIDRLEAGFTLTRHDQRGCGLSDRSLGEPSLSRFVDDLEAVADAAGLGRFALYAASQGVPIAIAFACRRPERVDRLVLHGGYRRGRLVRASVAERAQGEAIQTLIRHGWGSPGSAFLTSFAASFIPGATRAQLDSLAELQRLSATAETAAALRAAVDRFDVADLLGHIRCPTLVVHATRDGVHPFDQGRKLAAAIPGAQFLPLDSANHVILPQEPAWEVLFAALERFLGGEA
jgi:pimeloyl-ACP methyl ester carboxylesterase/DNA-binding winged helix-turn-helix (wHTH) protein